ncbi:MAG: hypothetical protein HC927_06520 [Deltaproteobacteria bacterium]|nr:hypothetical protein [Deltaproteobacteria bacterium]
MAVEYLGIFDAPSMVDLAGLPADASIENLGVGGDLASLTSIAMPPGGARKLRFSDWQRSSLDLLATASPAPLSISVSRAPLLEDLDDIAQCCIDQQAELSIAVFDTPLLTELQGLEPFTELARLQASGSPEVVSLAGLQNLEVVGELVIGDHCSAPDPSLGLTDLHGLEQLVEVADLEFSGQAELVSLAGLPTELVVGHADMSRNPMLAQALINAWFAAVMLQPQGCDNLDGPPCEGICPQ